MTLTFGSISKVDLTIDGQFYQTLNQQPFVFNVTKTLNEGQHLLAVRATDNQGQTVDTSATITINLSKPLSLVQPSDQSLLQFPVSLAAQSGKQYSGVNFYYQSGSGQSKLIGQSTNVDNISGAYGYTLSWQTSPAAGSYKVYAQAPDGTVSNKITVSVP